MVPPVMTASASITQNCHAPTLSSKKTAHLSVSGFSMEG